MASVQFRTCLSSSLGKRSASPAYSACAAPLHHPVCVVKHQCVGTARLSLDDRRQRGCIVARAGGPGDFGSDNNSTDLAFVAKLVVISVGGAAAIKYGSLLLDAPFDANWALALFLVLGPPSGYALFLLITAQKDAAAGK